MNKIKICFFVPFYPIIKGGGEYQAKIIANELREHGFDIFFISINSDKDDVEYYDGYKVYSIAVKPTIYNKLSLYNRLNIRINEILVIETPRIVYQRILNTFSYRVSQSLLKFNIPYILHIADNYSIDFNSFNGIFKKILFKRILNNQTKIICQTKYQKKIIRSLNYKEEIFLIPNMHPLIHMENTRKKDENKVVWIGNVRPVKQLEIYIELAESFINESYNFNIIGNIPNNKYGIGLKNRIEKLTNINYLGIKDNTFINEFLKDSSVLINTSESEGFSNTFIQAWMCGTPVISLNSDPDDIIKKYQIGRTCDGKFYLLKRNLKEILNDNDYKILSNKCISVSNSKFLIEKNISKLLILINKLLNQN